MASQELQTILQMFKAAPVPAAPPTLEEQRAGINAMAAMNPLPADVQCTKVDVAGVPGEWINAPGVDSSRVVLYLHGGGYVIGSIDSHRELVSRMSRASGADA